MKVLTEADLRTKQISDQKKEYHIPSNVFVTPAAKEYLRDRKIKIVTDPGGCQKAEEMTHIKGDRLVKKDHPRIVLRGKLDSLQAKILLLEARYLGQDRLCEDLDHILAQSRAILAAEVKEVPLEEETLLGMDLDKIREMSHQVKTYFGMDHPVPKASMGLLAMELNLLRTQVREAELSAVQAFPEGDPYKIVKHLNRLSSGVYILFCRMITGYYEKAEGESHG